MTHWVTHEAGESILLDGELFQVTQAARTRWGSPTYRLKANGGQIRWLTPRAPDALAPYVDFASIQAFVLAFYERVRADEILGPIFATRVHDWEPHLARMQHFWSAILLAAPGFQGNPMQKHRELEGVAPEDFQRWLALFADTLGALFEPEVADAIVARATRIAERLSYAMFAESA
jgi:hemoglobin